LAQSHAGSALARNPMKLFCRLFNCTRHLSLKVTERVHGVRHASHAVMKATSFEYIKVFYNRKRQHSSLGYLSPVQFMEKWLSRQDQEKR
jgi:transposase InsO family protein